MQEQFSFVSRHMNIKMPNYSTCPSKKGKRNLIVFEGHRYCHDVTSSTTSYYKCVEYKNCPGRGKKLIDSDEFTMTKEHNHNADIDKPDRM